MKKLLLLSVLYFAQGATAQNTCVVSFTDINLKNALLAKSSINTNGDTEIQCSEAASVTGEIYLYNKNIQYLNGMEAFTNATYLNVSGNQIRAFDLSGMTSLTRLDCNSNQIQNINVSNIPTLQILFCGNNPTTYIDVSNNPNLHSFHATGTNNLLQINLANGNNRNFTFLDVRGCVNLRCINVDDIAAISDWNTSDFNKDNAATYSTTCSLSTTDNHTTALLPYPNPTTGLIHFPTVSNVKVYDVTGRLIQQRDATQMVDITQQSNGIYVVQVENEMGNTTKRIVKQ